MSESMRHDSPSKIYHEALFALRFGQVDDFIEKVGQLPSAAVVDGLQENLLHKCARQCSAKGTRLLLNWKDNRPNMNEQNFHGETPLHLALQSLQSEDTLFVREAVETVLALVDADAKLFLFDKRGNTAFGLVGQPNCPAEVVLKVYHKVSERFSNIVGLMVNFSWHISASFHLKNTKLTQYILKWCANQLRPRSDGKKPNGLLHMALEAGSPVSTLHMLLHLGRLDVNAIFNGRTPLHVAAQKNFRSSHHLHIELLLTYGANPKMLDNRGMKPLQYIDNRDKSGLRDLLIAAESVKRVNDAAHLKLPETIFFAAAEGDLSTMQFMLTPSNINSKCSRGRTPLHYAAHLRRANAVYFLLAAGAEVDAVDNNGWSALLLAVHGDERKKQGDVVPVIGLLLHFGANIDHLGLNGETALSIALERSNDRAVYQLIRHIALQRYSPEQTAKQTMIESDDDLSKLHNECIKELKNMSENDKANGTNYLPMLRYTRQELILVACGVLKVNYMNSLADFPIYGNLLASRIHHGNLELMTFEELAEVADFHYHLDSLALSADEFIKFFHEKYLL